MKIIVDAMSGDLGAVEPVRGALLAAEREQVDILLVGRGEVLLQVLRDAGIATLPKGIEIADAADVVPMDAEGIHVLHAYRDSSMVQGLRLLSGGAGDAFVSAGNTGALITAATLLIHRIPGVRRAALCPVIPTATGGTVILDAGANAECTSDFLLQFAIMGNLFCRYGMGVPQPKVGLLNIGTEPGKGAPLQKEAHTLLTAAAEQGLFQFAGNVEARAVPDGAVDVAVCDGFSGNVLLKSIEGTASMVYREVRKMLESNSRTKLGALLCKREISAVRKRMDYREYGGSMLLGLRKPVIKAHGASDALAVCNAIRQAKITQESGMIAQIGNSISYIAKRKEPEHAG